MTTEPPNDAEDWSQEQWIAWLEATDAASVDEADPEEPRPLRRTSAGSMLGRAMHGLHEALFGPQEDQVVIEVGSGDPGGPEGMTLHLDEQDPAKSWVRIEREGHDDVPDS